MCIEAEANHLLRGYDSRIFGCASEACRGGAICENIRCIQSGARVDMTKRKQYGGRRPRLCPSLFSVCQSAHRVFAGAAVPSTLTVI